MYNLEADTLQKKKPGSTTVFGHILPDLVGKRLFFILIELHWRNQQRASPFFSILCSFWKKMAMVGEEYTIPTDMKIVL